MDGQAEPGRDTRARELRTRPQATRRIWLPLALGGLSGANGAAAILARGALGRWPAPELTEPGRQLAIPLLAGGLAGAALVAAMAWVVGRLGHDAQTASPELLERQQALGYLE